MPYRDVMDLILPPAGGHAAHITGHYGEMRAKGPHGGSDFNYVGGQAGINLTHPSVHSPVAGRVVFVGGRYGTVTIRDLEGNEHKLLHMDSQTVRRDQHVAAGDQIGTMGGRGPQDRNQYAQHVHYQMRDRDGRPVNPEVFWRHRDVPIAGSRGRARPHSHRQGGVMHAVRLFTSIVVICAAGCDFSQGSALSGSKNAAQASATSVSRSAVACPATEFGQFLRAFASDDSVRRQFTMPRVLVTDWRDVNATELGTVVEVVERDAYEGFTLRYRDDGFHDVGPDGGIAPDPSNVQIDRRGDDYLVAYSYNLAEGNSWLFKAKDGCWFLAEDPEPSDP